MPLAPGRLRFINQLVNVGSSIFSAWHGTNEIMIGHAGGQKISSAVGHIDQVSWMQGTRERRCTRPGHYDSCHFIWHVTLPRSISAASLSHD